MPHRLLVLCLVVTCFLVSVHAYFHRGHHRLQMMATITNKVSFQKMESNIIMNDKKIDLLFDGNCPLCLAEKNFLEKRDIHNKIRFTDLSSPDYNPAEHGNVKFSDGMRKIRAVLPDQTVITGVEVFRETYRAIGLGWIFEITKLPYVGELADALYDFWAENRLRITGRGDLADVLRERAELLKESGTVECEEDACDLFYEDDE